KDYVFISFILNHLPKGLVGLLFAMIFFAAMSSTASELNALASTTSVDIYKRLIKTKASDSHYVIASRLWTLFWGTVAILFALFGTLFENLIQFVNIVGSVFYGTILGVFLVAFYMKKIKGDAVFWAALIVQTAVIIIYFNFVHGDDSVFSFLWLNPIGTLGVMVISFLIQKAQNSAAF
ncbi:MAG: sodium:solute symporter, partial [Bacteroidia bacterium]|nr:sodium:solute symporter [Bacteroidia bacterium]